MKVPGLRSPHEKVGGIVYFGRMLDKIRLHAKSELPAEYHANLGEGFDRTCSQFLGVPYQKIVAHVQQGASDEETLEWCRSRGRRPDDEETHIWNEFLRKRGWNDAGSERLKQRKAESGFAARDDIQTFFDYIDADEGKPLRARPW
jgi:gluconokinase